MTDKDALVLFMPSGKRGRFPLGMPVLEAARQLGVYVESVCGGRATCGRCQVSVQEGNFAKHKIVSTATGQPLQAARQGLLFLGYLAYALAMALIILTISLLSLLLLRRRPRRPAAVS